MDYSGNFVIVEDSFSSTFDVSRKPNPEIGLSLSSLSFLDSNPVLNLHNDEDRNNLGKNHHNSNNSYLMTMLLLFYNFLYSSVVFLCPCSIIWRFKFVRQIFRKRRKKGQFSSNIATKPDRNIDGDPRSVYRKNFRGRKSFNDYSYCELDPSSFRHSRKRTVNSTKFFYPLLKQKISTANNNFFVRRTNSDDCLCRYFASDVKNDEFLDSLKVVSSNFGSYWEHTPYELLDTCSTSALTENSPFSDIYSLNPACLRRDPLQQHHRYGRIYSRTPYVFPTSIDEDIMPAEANLGYLSYTNGQRGSLPNSGSHLPSPTSSRFVNFFARPFRNNPLKRTKSVSKLERIKRSALDKESWSFNKPSTCPPTTSTNFMPCRQAPSPAECRPQQLFNNGSSWTTKNRARPSPSNIRNTRSHESLLTYSTSTTHAIDLSNRDCTVTPLHSSLLGSAHCFQIKTGTGATKYYACRTAMERNRWMENLIFKATTRPDHDQVVRQERSLKIWIFAAKGLQCKKRYYCEMYLDKNLYCRTTSKLKMNDECFWGEQFEITHLPKVETFSINLYKENDRKKRKEYKTNLIGVVQIPVSYLVVRHPIEKWYTVISNTEKSSKIDSSPSLRVKARYQVVTIMPLRNYDGLVQFIKNNYLLLCSAVEHVTSVKSKEDIATCLVHILHKLRLSKEFLCDLVVSEVKSLDNYHLMFRGNSLATKAMEAYMKLVGEQYLHDTLAEFVQSVVEYEEDCEVDTCKVSNYAYLIRQRENLFQLVQSAWGKIVNSSYYFPTELRIVFCELRNRLSLCHRTDLADYLISSNIFLRFLCPAILSPSLFDLIQGSIFLTNLN
uniref:Uncharacterized protein n=1 Tax=Romanomermis culicivorax TaxID=13658 RepID=A0A915KJ76_ROMCU